MSSHADKLAWQRRHRAMNGNADTKKYEKTVPGFLMRAYRNMASRAAGIQKPKAHLYRNCAVLPRADFYAWSHASDEFRRLFRIWQESGYDQRLTPSVDRRDSSGSYTLDNMRWITHSENSRLGAVSPKRKAA
jgi:hypothetical protein